MVMYVLGTFLSGLALFFSIIAFCEYKNLASKIALGACLSVLLLFQWGVSQPYKEPTEEKYNISFAESRAFTTIDGCLIDLNLRLRVNLEPGTITVMRHKGFWAGILWRETCYDFFQNGKFLGRKYYTEICG